MPKHYLMVKDTEGNPLKLHEFDTPEEADAKLEEENQNGYEGHITEGMADSQEEFLSMMGHKPEDLGKKPPSEPGEPDHLKMLVGNAHKFGVTKDKLTQYLKERGMDAERGGQYYDSIAYKPTKSLDDDKADWSHHAFDIDEEM